MQAAHVSGEQRDSDDERQQQEQKFLHLFPPLTFGITWTRAKSWLRDRCYTRKCLLRRYFFIALCIALVACHRKPSVPADVVARVGERMITLADFKRYLERNTGTDLAQMGPEVASAILDQYVEEIILS